MKKIIKYGIICVAATFLFGCGGTSFGSGTASSAQAAQSVTEQQVAMAQSSEETQRSSYEYLTRANVTVQVVSPWGELREGSLPYLKREYDNRECTIVFATNENEEVSGIALEDAAEALIPRLQRWIKEMCTTAPDAAIVFDGPGTPATLNGIPALRVTGTYTTEDIPDGKLEGYVFVVNGFQVEQVPSCAFVVSSAGFDTTDAVADLEYMLQTMEAVK